jgi:hypothetical protein
MRAQVRPWVAAAADAAVLVAFVVIGRRSHHEGGDVEGFLRVLWPFAVGLVAGYTVTALWREPLARRRGAVAWLVTVGVGEALRLGAQDRELKIGFLVVAVAFFGAGMLGWRSLVRLRARRGQLISR